LAALLGIFLDLAQTAPQHHLITVLPYLALQCAVSSMRKGRRRSGSKAASFASTARSPAPPSQPAPPTQQWFGALAAHGQWVLLWSPVGHIGQAPATGRTWLRCVQPTGLPVPSSHQPRPSWQCSGNPAGQGGRV
jgi:hypothetical protein